MVTRSTIMLEKGVPKQYHVNVSERDVHRVMWEYNQRSGHLEAARMAIATKAQNERDQALASLCIAKIM